LILNKRINTDKLFFALVCIVAISLPFSKQVVGITTGLLIILTFLRFNTTEFSGLSRLMFYAIVGFFAMHLVCLVYTDDLVNGLSHIEMKLSMLAFPLIFAFADNKFDKKKIEKVLLFYAISMCLVSLTSLGYAFYRYLYHQHIYKQNIFFFYYSDLVQPFDFSPSYYSMYVSFAALVLLIFILTNYAVLKPSQRALLVLAIVFLTGFNVLMSARMPLIAFFLLFGFILIKRIRVRSMTGYGVLILSVVCLFSFLALNKYTIRRIFTMDKLTYTIDNPDFKAWNAVTIRVAIWKTNSRLIADNWLFGVGRGDADKKILEAYKENRYFYALNERYNLHNQYLQTMLSVGLIGLIFLLMIGWLGLNLAFREGNWYLIAFLILVLLCFITEAVLARLKGVLFFSFFVSLLGFHSCQSYKK